MPRCPIQTETEDCPRHKMPHPGHTFSLSQDDTEAAETWRQALDRIVSPQLHELSMFRKGVNLLNEHTRWVEGGSIHVPDFIRGLRRQECDACAFRDPEKDACKHCGCYLHETVLGDKLRMDTAKCPAGIWPEYNAESLCELLEADTEQQLPSDWHTWPHVWPAFRLLLNRAIARFKENPLPAGEGDGVVICGGGKYFSPAYCNIRLLRQLGCQLPIELWYLGRNNEMPPEWIATLADLNVRCVDADTVRKEHPMRVLNGWELKFYAVARSAFKRVIFLDADCYPLRDPTFILSDPRFLGPGAMFQRDCVDSEKVNKDVMAFFGLPAEEAWDLETGAFAIDRPRWDLALQVTVLLNAYSDMVYKVVYGDKTTPYIAARLTGHTYAIPSEPPGGDGWGLMQKWFDGADLYMHLIHAKPRFGGEFISDQNHSAPPYFRSDLNAFLAQLRAALPMKRDKPMNRIRGMRFEL